MEVKAFVTAVLIGMCVAGVAGLIIAPTMLERMPKKQKKIGFFGM